MISNDVKNMIPKIQQFFIEQPVKKAWLFGLLLSWGRNS